MGKVMVVEKGLPVAPAGTRKIDLVGKVFDRLTVIRQDGYAYGNAKWLCQCSCGAAVSIRGDYLRRGKAKSCGCLRIEKITTHGETNSLEYSSWRSMIDRCYNPKNISYEYYGGRGITVCDRWKDSFENFLAD